MTTGKKMIGIAAILGTMCIVVSVGHALAKRDKKKGSVKLPPAARTAIQKAFPGARIHHVEKEKKAITLYEAKLVKGDAKMEVEVSADGTIVEVEQHVTKDELPAPVAAALAKVAGDAQIKEIEREEIHAVLKLVKLKKPAIVFEAEFLKDGKTIEVKINSDGKILSRKIENDDEDDDENDDEKEKKVSLDQVPEAVKKATLKEAGSNPIREIEVETRHGRTIYEAEWIADGKEVEIKLSKDGKVLRKHVDDDD